MSRIILLYVFVFCISYTCSQIIEPNGGSNKNEADDTKKVDNNKQNVESSHLKDDEKPKLNIPAAEVVATTTTAKTTIGSNIKNNTNTDIEAGAVLRGVFVFVGITLLFIMYLTFKTYRKRNKKNVLIKKYGVKTRRTDVEMEPLPLDDDEEDETVFDLGNVNNR